MKIKKKWKRYVHQIAFACLLICCVVQWIPDLVYADSSDLPSYDSENFDGLLLSSESVKTDFTDGNGEHVNCEINASGSKNVYLIKYQNSYTFVSREPFSYTSHYTLDDGTLYSNKKDTSSLAKCNHYQFYLCPVNIPGNELDCVYYSLPDWETLKKMKDSNPSKYDSIPFHFYGGLMYDIQCMKMYSVEGKRAPGSVNNPIEDAEIGTIEISGKAYAQDTTANSDNIDEQFYTMWNWKNKTSTGFSLTKNKYHMTRIQVMVESRCLVYSDLKHKTVKEKFENYGERNKLKNGILPTDKPYTIYLKDVMSALPKTKGEFHNVLFCGYNFKYYWRVMCNDSPTGTGKWYCGGWRAVDLNQDSNKSKDINDTNNGHFDDDGNWVNDEDDGHNNTTDYSDDVSGQNPDDAKDTITNPKKDKDDKFGWDDFKSLINECKQVPGLIKSVFSFLPDWVLVFVAIGFGIWIFVLIKRAIV